MSYGPVKFAKMRALTTRPATTPTSPPWCRECGAPFYVWRNDMAFCRPQCRRDNHKRRYKWGGLLYDMVLAWRVDRIAKGWSKMTQLADQIAKEERDRRKAHAMIRAEAEQQE